MQITERTTHALTIGVIAEQLSCPVHRVVYVINSRSIRASLWAGHARVFDEAAVNQIATAIKRIDADKARLSP